MGRQLSKKAETRSLNFGNGKDENARGGPAERVPVRRAKTAALFGQDDQEKAQNQNQNKRSNGPDMLCFLKLRRQQKVRIATISSRNMRAGNGIDVLQAGAGVVVRNGDAGEQQESHHEDRGSAQKSHTPASRARALPLAPPMANQCADAQGCPREVQKCVHRIHFLPGNSMGCPYSRLC
jgi:hypothetical protein